MNSSGHGPEHVDFDLLKIRDAVAAIRTYAGNVGRDEAAVLLPLWSGYHTLGEKQRLAILDRFGGRS